VLSITSAIRAEDAGTEPLRLLFTGDILLGRQVAREIATRRMSPWHDMGDTLKRADFVFGNFEGTVGRMEDCAGPKELCFAVSPQLMPMLKDAGFTAVGTANNHSGDLGGAGRRTTDETLKAAGVFAIGSEQSPAFFRVGAHTLALVNLGLVPGRDGKVDAIPSWQVAQKLRLAHALADWVIVSVHWGKELADWVVPEQETQARWLVAHGADLIIGAHPHVIQPPACVDGKPVFFSLGNHVFDQKYPITKDGLIADCRIADDRLVCGGIRTHTPEGSAFPSLAATPTHADELSECPVAARPTLVVAGQALGPWIRNREIIFDHLVIEGRSADHRWRSATRAILALDRGRLAADQPPLLFTLERHLSPIDDEDGPRPYVYEVTPHGLVARWRGSALAWPLLDATLIADTAGRAYLCALHRGDAFVMLDTSKSVSLRTQVYVWNGFGFSGVADTELATRCARQFDQQSP
jgi:poly-gamma-glutamate synthesis protein (capsule biosynthesis protein)